MKRHPIIIIDGPDACGKTTWARAYCDRYNGRYIHLTLREKMLEHQAVSLHMACKWSADRPVVIDRHWISEQIYGGVYRGGTQIAQQALNLDELIVDVIGAVYVIAILQNPRTMAHAHAEMSMIRDEMYVPDQRTLEVANGYYDLWHGTKYCNYETGSCLKLAPLKTRKTQAMLYDYQSMGASTAELTDHVSSVHAVAKARREFVINDPITQSRLFMCEKSSSSLMHLANLSTTRYPSKI
jgi:hypothetical protein